MDTSVAQRDRKNCCEKNKKKYFFVFLLRPPPSLCNYSSVRYLIQRIDTIDVIYCHQFHRFVHHNFLLCTIVYISIYTASNSTGYDTKHQISILSNLGVDPELYTYLVCDHKIVQDKLQHRSKAKLTIIKSRYSNQI